MVELAPHNKRGLNLANPIMNAAGILGFARESRGIVDLALLGAFVTNAITATARTPAHPPNAVPLPDGLLIHTGLPNPGARTAIRRWARDWQRLGPPVVVHVAATSPEDVRRCVAAIEGAEAVSGVELGLHEDVSAADLGQLVRAASTSLPLIVRLPLGRAAELCGPAAAAGADALTVGAPPLITTQVGARIISGRRYSPDVFQTALDLVKAVSAIVREAELPVIGAGGLFSLEAVQMMLAAGATAVQLDAVLWREPEIVARLATVGL